MFAPIRLLNAIRPTVRPGFLVATAASTIVFSATPFLIPAIAAEFDVSLGVSALVSTAQLGGFVAGSWQAGRWFQPSQRLLRAALAVLVGANLASAAAPHVGVLFAGRVVAGIGLGIVAWLAWAEAFGNEQKTSDVAVVGPIVAVASSPLVSVGADEFGPRWLYAALALVCAVPLAFDGRPAAPPPPARTSRPPAIPVAKVLLASLFLLTLGGSAVFVFGAAIGTDQVGLPAGVVALGFSANALASVPSARWKGSRPFPGGWMLGTAICAIALGAASQPAVFFAAMVLWGFCFWMGIPGAFALLSERSAHPAERAGDAQAVMAAGRVVGPLIGGIAIDVGSPTVLGVVGGGLMACGSAVLLLVERRPAPMRSDRPPGPDA